ncbi:MULTISPECIES: DUF4876 domain-containing protein [Prevotella]|uniref:DUF4876 domain-containing protein n=1 Tax=Prevotella herbatica TaxID=2801997 RepID=A0ABM7NW98_9BACT|nr:MULTISPECIES: DUF4876 domain-containing protein [Prevotella]MDN5552837.1 DUF4876 domain-containing protein [Prevotella sp.]BCS84724.1 DUF4876 domain-containing protein [Prevotella herbatica]
MNTKEKFRLILAFIAVSVVFASCKDNDNENEVEQNVKFAMSLDMPLNINSPSLTGATATLTNVQTKKTYVAKNFRRAGTQYVDTTEVPEGNYTLDIRGGISYNLDTTIVNTSVKATESNVIVNKTSTGNDMSHKTIALNTYNAQDGFVISEMFFTGTLTPEGKQYSNDQYIKIANNSDSVLYADGLAFVESSFMTVSKFDYTPDIMNQAMTIDAIYIIPGSGKDHPIKPGQEITLALNAKNHKEINANSIDLSNADFEFYDVSSNPKFSDDDNPNVPNLANWYDYSNTYFTLHNRGYHSYAIAKPETDKETFLRNYYYKYSYVMSANGNSYTMNKDGYKLPNSWIIDAVNLSIAASYQWNVVSASLDAGWAHCGSIDADKTRFSKAVVRKKSGNRFIDTNNSTEDFESDATPTLLK